MIPPEGRDVQCSACTHVWFQPAAPAAAPMVLRGVAPPRPDSNWDEDEPDLPPLTEADLPPLRRPKLDDEMLAVLREEAEREAAARAEDAARLRRITAQSAPAEGEADLQLAPRAHSGEIPPEAPAPEEAEILEIPPETEPEAGEPPPAPPRRDLLPDIEQINSTLDGTPGMEFAAGEAMTAAASRRRGGFARGFAVALLICLLAAVVYLKAAPISRMIPAAEPALAGWVAGVDAARLQLDRFVRDLLAGRE